MKKLNFGIDFGTTNSSLSVFDGKSVPVLPIDEGAVDPGVVRSMLYFARRELVYNKSVPKLRQRAGIFFQNEITYEGEQKVLIGQEAVNKYLAENKNRTPGIKRTFFTGRLVRARDTVEAKSDLVPEYYEEVDYGTGRLFQALKSALRTSYTGTVIFGKKYTIEELIGIFLREIKEKAERDLRFKIDDLRIGRPVRFSDNPAIDKRAEDRLREGVKLAGFKKVKFEYEPVAAARSYLYVARGPASRVSRRPSSLVSLAAGEASGSLSRVTPLPRSSILLIFDFGGGTLDTAVLKGDKVLATDGVYIGGDLLNADIMQDKLWPYFGSTATWSDQNLPMPTHIYEALGSWYSIPTLNNPDMMNQLETLKYKNSDVAGLERLIYLIKMNLGFEIYEAIEKAKKELSVKQLSVISLKSGPIQLEQKINRAEFKSIIQGRIDEVKGVVLRTLVTAGVKPSEVDQVIRTGGSSLIPVFENILVELFGKEKVSLFDTFTSIAAGLALD